MAGVLALMTKDLLDKANELQSEIDNAYALHTLFLNALQSDRKIATIKFISNENTPNYQLVNSEYLPPVLGQRILDMIAEHVEDLEQKFEEL